MLEHSTRQNHIPFWHPSHRLNYTVSVYQLFEGRKSQQTNTGENTDILKDTILRIDAQALIVPS